VIDDIEEATIAFSPSEQYRVGTLEKALTVLDF